MNWLDTLKPKAPRDLTDAILIGIQRAGIYMGLMLLSAGAAVLLTPDMDWSVDYPQESGPTMTLEPVTPVEDLMAEHNCWTDEKEAPKNVIPSKAIVSPVGKGPKVVNADRGFRIWLEGAPGTLHAFCP